MKEAWNVKDPLKMEPMGLNTGFVESLHRSSFFLAEDYKHRSPGAVGFGQWYSWGQGTTPHWGLSNSLGTEWWPWSPNYPAPRVLAARSLPSRQDAGGFPSGEDDTGLKGAEGQEWQWKWHWTSQEKQTRNLQSCLQNSERKLLLHTSDSVHIQNTKTVSEMQSLESILIPVHPWVCFQN